MTTDIIRTEANYKAAHADASRDGLLAAGATENGLLADLRGRRENEYIPRTRIDENVEESAATLHKNGVTLETAVAALLKNKQYAEIEEN